MTKRKFIKYVLSFYGEGGIYANFFTPIMTEEEIEKAVDELETMPNIKSLLKDYDTFSREMVRDYLLVGRGATKVDYRNMVSAYDNVHNRRGTNIPVTIYWHEHDAKIVAFELEYHGDKHLTSDFYIDSNGRYKDGRIKLSLSGTTLLENDTAKDLQNSLAMVVRTRICSIRVENAVVIDDYYSDNKICEMYVRFQPLIRDVEKMSAKVLLDEVKHG